MNQEMAEKIIERLRKFWPEDALMVSVDFWEHGPKKKITTPYRIWIGDTNLGVNFDSMEELLTWIHRKELLFRRF